MLASLKGWKTFAVFSPVLLLSLLDALNAIDLTPLFVVLGIPEPSRAVIITGMSVLAIVLRIYSTTPVLRQEPPSGHEAS